MPNILSTEGFNERLRNRVEKVSYALYQNEKAKALISQSIRREQFLY